MNVAQTSRLRALITQMRELEEEMRHQEGAALQKSKTTWHFVVMELSELEAQGMNFVPSGGTQNKLDSRPYGHEGRITRDAS